MYIKKSCLAGLNRVPEVMTSLLDIMSGPKINRMAPKNTSIKVADATTVSWKIERNLGNLRLSRLSSFLPKRPATLSTNQIANCCW